VGHDTRQQELIPEFRHTNAVAQVHGSHGGFGSVIRKTVDAASGSGHVELSR
jgi:hypothetical protein